MSQLSALQNMQHDPYFEFYTSALLHRRSICFLSKMNNDRLSPLHEDISNLQLKLSRGKKTETLRHQEPNVNSVYLFLINKKRIGSLYKKETWY